MPVFFDSDPRIVGQDTPGECITIGLVNNMGDEALKATERQYTSLLNAASDGVLVRLSFYNLPGIDRSTSIGRHVRNVYSNIEELWDAEIDGLIVTGREPMAKDLSDEPYWESFTRLLAWAEENASSTVWSCLAAHAAILHMDGIKRVKRDDKLFGIFECERMAQHPLTSSIATSFKLPHSRWNGIDEEQLTDCGYTVLTRGADAGVDTFVKQQKKLFVFFQGHPEYESDTLLREYRRDVGRYFREEVSEYPSMPKSYFDEAMVAVLSELREKAITKRNADLFLEISNVLAMVAIGNTWQSSATGIYKNWLHYLVAQKRAHPSKNGIHGVASLAPVS